MDEDDVSQLVYFNKIKDDPACWAGYSQWAKDNPREAAELERLLSDVRWGRKRVALYLSDLLEGE